MKIGTPICNNVSIEVCDITNVIPAKWDGMSEKFVVCEPKDAQGYMVITISGDTIMIKNDCSNKELLLDII